MSAAGPGRPRWTQQHSAGGVVVRAAGGTMEFLAIKPAHRDRWQLPKGTIDRGETPPQAALREVREEGGVDGRILADLGPIRFFYQMGGGRFVKTVDFFLMVYEGGSPDDHDHEVQEARWIPMEQLGRLAFPSERGVVRKAQAILNRQGFLNPPGEAPPGPPAAP
jgi:8-oxo-dGTP pyrophosphatase MutT (NUDIX family)